jgi:alpha-2-macroglobulin
VHAILTPSPGTPGEGWGGGLSKAAFFAETPSLTLPRSTGGGNREGQGSTQAPTTQPIAHGLTWLDLRASALSAGDLDLGGRAYLRSGFEAFVYTDRGVYRPGETVHLRAIVRGPDQSMPPEFPVRWQLRRPDLHNWKAQVVQLDADGAASMELQIPDDLPTGRWTAEIGLPSDDRRSERTFGSTTFLIEEFMPQRMKVTLKLGDSDPPRLSAADQTIPVRVQADYLFGRPAEGQAASVAARIDPTIFAPTAFKGWGFGDTADALTTLGAAKPLGRRRELPGAALNVKGQAKWNLDLDDLLENGEKADEQPAKLSPKRASRKAKNKQPAKSEEDFAGPWKLTVSASVTEAGGRAVSATRQVDVDRVSYYVGLKLRDSSPRPGIPANYDVRLVTPAGTVAQVDQPMQATLYRESWNSSYVYEDGHYHYSSTRLLEPLSKEPLTVNISAGVGEGSLTLPQPGNYVLLLRDPQTNGVASCEIACWYGSWEDNISRDNPQRLQVSVQPIAPATFDDFIAGFDKLDLAGWLDRFAVASSKSAPVDRARIGQRAQVVVRSPFPGRLLLAVETDGVLNTRVIDMPATHIAVPIDVTDACRPNAYVSATVIRGVDPNARWSTHRAFGATRIIIDDSDRRLKVELAAPKEMRPATSLHVDLRVTDDNGASISNAAVTVAAVDEGICLLTNFQTPDPLRFFTANRALGVHWADAFDQLIPEIAAAQSAVGGDESGSIGHQNPVSAKRVKPVALFSGVLHTDADGIAHADFNVPQFTGQLRLMAVASAERRFGSEQATVLVRSPLLVQSSWPRFAAPGDRFSVAMDVFNNSSASGEASVTVELDEGPLRFASGVHHNAGAPFSPSPGTPGEGRGGGLGSGAHLVETPSLTLPRSTGGGNQAAAGKNKERSLALPLTLRPNGHSLLHFDVIADDRAGIAHAHLIAHFGGESFEENIELPVRPASPPVALGDYMIAKPDAPALVSLPQGMLPGSGKFELRISPQPQLQIPQGLDYLDRYPYGCLEQTTSTLFPLVYLPDIGQRIAPGLFERDRVADKVRVGILRMMSMQTADGGLAMWPGGREAWPWGTVYAAHFLAEAQIAGYEIPDEFDRQVLSYVRGLLARPEQTEDTLETQTYAAYVLALAGKPQRPAMFHLNERLLSAPSHPARFHLALAWLAAGRGDLARALLPRLLPEPRAARQLNGALGSPTRDRALLAMALLAAEPRHPALPELMNRLALEGSHHQWRSTQDVAFAVMAIGRYLRLATPQAPYDGAELLIDGKTIATIAKGEPLAWLAPADLSPDAKIQVRTKGAADSVAHVAWLQSGVPLKRPAAADQGIQIRRRFLDEHGQPLKSDIVHSGDLVQVELTVKSDQALEHVVIDDLLPAGLEIENPRLENQASARPVRPSRKSDDDQPQLSVTRLDMRDDRLILVADISGGHTGTYIYTARAVTVGQFIVPPAQAQCMYDMGISSISDTGMLRVLPVETAPIAATED